MRTIVALAAAAVLAASLDGAAQTPPCGSTIYASVTLNSDLVCGGGPHAIAIGANNIRIELNGYSILGGPYGPAVGVRSSGVNGVQIVGPGRIDFFAEPIQVTGGAGHLIQDMQTDQPGKLTLRNVSGSRVEGNRFSYLALESDPGQVAGKNEILRNEVVAVYPGIIALKGCGTADNLVFANTIDSPAQAIRLGAGANRNRVAYNKIKAAYGGIVLDDASANYIDLNRIEVAPAGGSGIRIAAYGGPLACAGGVVNARDNSVVKNEVDGGQTGILLSGYPGRAYAKDNRVTDNFLHNHALADLAFVIGADNNDARGNNYLTQPANVIDRGIGNLWP